MTASRWPRFAVAAFGLLWFVQLGGWQTLNPLHTAWLYSTGDWPQHWLGFIFFQREPWAVPLGSVSSLLYPIGTNIGFTDSNPILAILAKPFARFMPGEFQLIGPWLASCFVLQGYTGAALVSTVTEDRGHQLLGGALLVLSPVLAVRVGHDTLCAHWVLLGLLYLGLREYRDGAHARRGSWWGIAAVVLAAGVHPYLVAMAWTLALGLMIRLWVAGFVSAWRALGVMALATAGVLAVWSAIGYFSGARDLTWGFGEYASSLLTLIDPANLSRLLPDLPGYAGDYEGVGFLGLGGIVAFGIAVAVVLRVRPTLRPGMWAPIGACALLGIYAFSSHVRLAGHEVLNLEWLYAPLITVTKTFRSSGRFIWPLHYLALVFGVWGVTRASRRMKPELGTLLLAVVVILQATDLKADRAWPEPGKGRQIALEPYALAAGQYRHLALVPMQVFGACGNPFEQDYVYRMMLLAYRLNLTINSGYFARIDIQAVRAQCDALERDVDAGALDPQTIYIAAESEVPRFRKAGAACGRWDGNWVCVSRQSNERFRVWIETERDIGAGSSGK